MEKETSVILKAYNKMYNKQINEDENNEKSTKHRDFHMFLADRIIKAANILEEIDEKTNEFLKENPLQIVNLEKKLQNIKDIRRKITSITGEPQRTDAEAANTLYQLYSEIREWANNPEFMQKRYNDRIK